jgi:hypothetical protein
MKKGFGFILSSLSALSLSSALVSANVASDFMSTTFNSWMGGQLEPWIGKILFALLVGTIIYAIAGIMPFFSKSAGTRTVFTIAATVLATAFLTPADVTATLLSWTALGITMGTILPFIVLSYFTFELAKTEGSASQKLFNKLLGYLVWIMYLAAMIYKINSNDQWENALAWGNLVLTAIVILALPAIYAWVNRELIAQEITNAGNTFNRARTALSELAKTTSFAAGEKTENSK